MRCEGFADEDYGMLALGALEEPERAAIEDHLAQGCSRCMEQMRVSRELWQGIGMGVPLAAPSRRLRRSIVQSVGHLRGVAWLPVWQTALAGLAVAGFALWGGWVLAGKLHPAAPIVEQVPVAVPAPVTGSDQLDELQRANQELRDRLAKSSPAAPASKAPGIHEANSREELARTRESLEQARKQASEAAQQLAPLRTALESQGASLASARENEAEANRKLAAALRQPNNSDDLQRQLARAISASQQLEREVAQYKLLLATERQRPASPPQLTSLLSDPGLRLVRLRATEKGDGSEAHALVSAGSQVVFFGSALPSPPAGRVYQLWLIRRASPAIVSAGTFTPDNGRRASVEFANPTLTGGITGIAVTDEPAGGSPAPTGHKLLVGS